MSTRQIVWCYNGELTGKCQIQSDPLGWVCQKCSTTRPEDLGSQEGEDEEVEVKDGRCRGSCVACTLGCCTVTLPSPRKRQVWADSYVRNATIMSR